MFKRVVPVLIGVAGVAMGLSGGLMAQTPTLPPAVAISREPLELDPAKWVGCKRVEGGSLCAPAIQTGTPEIQARLRAQQAAAQAAGVTPPPPIPLAPMTCAVPMMGADGKPLARVPQGGRGPIRVPWSCREISPAWEATAAVTVGMAPGFLRSDTLRVTVSTSVSESGTFTTNLSMSFWSRATSLSDCCPAATKSTRPSNCLVSASANSVKIAL